MFQGSKSKKEKKSYERNLKGSITIPITLVATEPESSSSGGSFVSDNQKDEGSLDRTIKASKGKKRKTRGKELGTMDEITSLKEIHSSGNIPSGSSATSLHSTSNPVIPSITEYNSPCSDNLLQDLNLATVSCDISIPTPSVESIPLFEYRPIEGCPLIEPGRFKTIEVSKSGSRKEYLVIDAEARDGSKFDADGSILYGDSPKVEVNESIEDADGSNVYADGLKVFVDI